MHTIRLRARHHEMDAQGHVNNAVYLNWVEEAAIEHARALGFEAERWRALGGVWVVRRHEVEYRQPAVAGDDLEITTRIVGFDRVRGIRRTSVVRANDGALLVEALTEWVWIGLDGRPKRLPAEVAEAFAPPEDGSPSSGGGGR